MDSQQQATILLVEDEQAHARLIERNLRRNNIENKISRVEDGLDALDFINRFNTSTQPLLVLLDINLPSLSGYQVLQRIKENPRTRHIPVIVLTTTDDQHDVQRCYELGCNFYIAKPINYKKFTEAIAAVGRFLTLVQVPNPSYHQVLYASPHTAEA